MTGLRIYVAGASTDRERVARYMGALREAGWEVTEDWCAAEAASGLDDGDLDDVTATAAARRDLNGIDRADVFWLVAPERPSFGACTELGYAVARRGSHDAPTRIIISGPCPSIFARLADRRYPSHVAALQALTEPVNG